MQFPQLNRARSNPLHPASLSNVFRNECRPDRDRLHLASTGRGFESHTTRISIPKYAEGVEVVVILDFTMTNQLTIQGSKG